MKFKITDLKTFQSYQVSSLKECKDDTDKSAVEECMKFKIAILMGSILIEPVDS